MTLATSRTNISSSVEWRQAAKGDPLGLVLLSAIYLTLFKTFFMFARPDHDAAASGSATNQIIWTGLTLLAVLVIIRNRTTARWLLTRSWPLLVPLAWFALSILWSPYFDLSFRRVTFLIFTAIGAFAVAAARPTPSDFLKVTVAVTGIVILINVLSVFAVPNLARTFDGTFLGIYPHKNTAGRVAALAFLVLLFAGLWASQPLGRFFFLGGAAVGFFFLLGTHSKTSIGLAIAIPPTAFVVFSVFGLKNNMHRILSYFVIVLIFLLFILYILFADIRIEEIGIFIFDDLTFTGRTVLWEYVVEAIRIHPILGHGYGGFWFVGPGKVNSLRYAVGYSAIAPSAHNGYLEIMLHGGLIGLVLCVVPILRCLGSILYLLKIKHLANSMKWVYVLMLSLFLFFTLRNMLESSLFKPGTIGTSMLFLMLLLTESWRSENEGKHAQTGRESMSGVVG